MTKSLSIDWHFAQPPEVVWQAWTDADWIAEWVGSDPAGKVLGAKVDVRPGGKFEFAFVDSDKTEHTSRGTYERVEPHRLLSFSWGWKSEPGIETFISVALSPEGQGTSMRFEHSGIDYVSTHDYASGWRSTFEKMQKVIATRIRAERRGGPK